MRKSLGCLTALVTAVLCGLTLGACAPLQQAAGVPSTGPVETYLGTLRLLPGVKNAQLEVTGDRTNIYNLTVTVADEITATELAEVGRQAGTFAERIAQAQLTSGTTRIERADSSYSYFANLSDAELATQIEYWLALQQNEGVKSVNMGEYHQGFAVGTAGAAAKPSSAANPQRQAAVPTSDSSEDDKTPRPRYVAIELSEGSDTAAAESTLTALRAIHDPGVATGQWDISLPSEHLKSQFRSPVFPDTTVFTQTAGIAATLGSITGLASTELVYEQQAAVPLRIEVVAFDRAMAEASTDSAEAAFTKTELWRQLKPLMAQLSDRVSYRVEVLANPLTDGGNFKLDFTVAQCVFHADPTWPVVSQELGTVWVRAMKSSGAGCTPQFASVTKK